MMRKMFAGLLVVVLLSGCGGSPIVAEDVEEQIAELTPVQTPLVDLVEQEQTTPEQETDPFGNLADDVENWLSSLITATLADNGTIDLNVCGQNYQLEVTSVGEDKLTFNRIAYGEIIRFHFTDDNKIQVEIALGKKYDEWGMPEPFGDLTAYVIFDGEKFALSDYEFSLY